MRLGLRQPRATPPFTSLRTGCVMAASLALLALFAKAGCVSAYSQSLTGAPLLASAQQVRELKPDEAQKSLPARLRGVITYYDPLYNNLFLQDATAGIFVLMNTNLGSSYVPVRASRWRARALRAISRQSSGRLRYVCWVAED
jgi:hypothetical protein